MKQDAITTIIDRARRDNDYYVLLIGSICIAIGAIFTDSIAVLIASMIIAPLASPILALGFGIAVGSKKLVLRASIMLMYSCVIALAIAAIVTLLFGKDRTADRYITFNSNHIIAVSVAVVSGIIAAYGTVKPKVSGAITGVAIAVSLMPPLVAVGINFTAGDTSQGYEAGLLFLLNVVGILLASIITYTCFRMRQEYRTYNEKQQTD
jgi:uncharacterized hydrophobic protein (TIGR00271 family)